MPKALPGQPLRIFASDYNAMLDAARAYRARQHDLSVPFLGAGSAGIVPMRNEITREGASRKIDVTLNVADRDLGAVARDVEARVGELEFATGYHPEVLGEWKEQREAQKKGQGHDTLALLVLDASGDIAGGCSTSGFGYKMPGRVGDSPILGSGLYVDSEVGAAGASGQGEVIMRYCGSFTVVELMRQGMAPREACAEAIERILRKEPDVPRMHFVALDRQGRFGAATTLPSFSYAVATEDFSRVVEPVIVEGP